MLRPRKCPKCRPSPLAALLALLAACRAGGASAPGPVVIQAATAGPLSSDPANPARFQALASALAEGEDELARTLAADLGARALSAREKQLVVSAERVLRGRELVRSLDLELASEPVSGDEGRFRLVLVARSRASEPLRLKLPPCDLKRARASMDSRGFEGLELESKASPALADLALPPGGEQRVVLLEYELPLGRALGVRERWRMETRSGSLELGKEAYPAANVKVAGCERERFSPLLDPKPVAVSELVERLNGTEMPGTRALLELALRIPLAEREAALVALAPVVSSLARSRPERVTTAEPALRWLTQNRDLGPDAAAWARYLDARVAAGAETERTKGGLDLPARRAEAGSAR